MKLKVENFTCGGGAASSSRDLLSTRRFHKNKGITAAMRIMETIRAKISSISLPAIEKKNGNLRENVETKPNEDDEIERGLIFR